jgi:hypothetical protein
MCNVCGSDLRNLWGKKLKLKRKESKEIEEMNYYGEVMNILCK